LKTIEIVTPQNVIVQYNLASVWERAFALALDIIIMWLSSWIFFGLLAFFFNGQIADILMYFTVIPFILFYSLAFENLNNGQSLGKKVLKIRVIRMDGAKSNFWDYLMRWMFRSLDIYSTFGGVSILSITSSSHNQRIGDLLGNTVVVNVGKTERMPLENLMKLGKMENYKITYPQVAKMPEELMLLVKESLGKQLKYKNAAHNQAIDLLVLKLENELSVKATKDKRSFLTTLLKDYIILTR
jgi:uncharacterized RDD family membrane protein YckC